MAPAGPDGEDGDDERPHVRRGKLGARRLQLGEPWSVQGKIGHSIGAERASRGEEKHKRRAHEQRECKAHRRHDGEQDEHAVRDGLRPQKHRAGLRGRKRVAHQAVAGANGGEQEDGGQKPRSPKPLPANGENRCYTRGHIPQIRRGDHAVDDTEHKREQTPEHRTAPDDDRVCARVALVRLAPAGEEPMSDPPRRDQKRTGADHRYGLDGVEPGLRKDAQHPHRADGSGHGKPNEDRLHRLARINDGLFKRLGLRRVRPPLHAQDIEKPSPGCSFHRAPPAKTSG